MDPVQETLTRHAEELERINRWRNSVDESLQQLRESDARILEVVGRSATKEDMGNLRAHFDGSINGILRDALNAVPAHAQARIARWQLLVGIGSVLVAIAAIIIGLHSSHVPRP